MVVMPVVVVAAAAAAAVVVVVMIVMIMMCCCWWCGVGGDPSPDCRSWHNPAATSLPRLRPKFRGFSVHSLQSWHILWPYWYVKYRGWAGRDGGCCD